MTKKKPSPQNRIWEKERRERLNKTFDDLQRLLPEHEPASTLSKVEILQRAIEHINKLQKKIKVLVEESNDPLKEHVKEQELRLKRLLVRNEELAELLRKAKITVPPCKYTIADDECQLQNEEKENGNRHKKTGPKQRRTGAAPKKQPVIENEPPASVASSEAWDKQQQRDKLLQFWPYIACALPTYIAALNVTPALLPTPIMTTSVLISNNGNLVQVPIVAPPSSLLIVGNEDVRSKINLKNRPLDGNASRYRSKRGKFTIKSIDLIPGRIVNGKIPIPPLRRNTNDTSKSSKGPRLKRKRLLEKSKRLRKSSICTTTKQDKNHDTSNAKRARLQEQDKSHNTSTNKGNGTQQKLDENMLETPAQLQSCSVVPEETKPLSKEQEKNAQTNVNAPTHETHLDINLNQADLSEDIFANLHVGPDGQTVHGGNEDGTLSPTAAYLMNFPLVAGGGKAAGNHADTGEADECHDQQSSKPNNTPANEQTGSMILENFSSFFNYGHIDAMGVAAVGQDISTLHSIPALTASAMSHTTTSITTASSVAAVSSSRENTFNNYPTTYQSIDNMLDSRPVAPNRSVIGGTTNRSLSTECEFPSSVTFTFTLTSNTCTAPTTVHPSISSGHFYGPSCGALNPVKPVDDFSSPLKPSIEFTFSLTSTTASQPKTVQSQYTNSTILSTTMTTPSYDTYGYFHKNVPKSSNYCSSFNVLDPLLSTEKPATSFTFSLTSSTKTEPSYTHSTIVTVPTNATQAYGTPPKLSAKQQQQQQHHASVDSLPAKQEPASKPEKPRTAPRIHMETSTVRSGPSNGVHPPQQQQQIQPQQQTQTKYDVSWMAAGVQHGHSTSSSQNSQQQTEQPNYETIPPQIIPPIEFPPTGGYTSTNNYKSDIFFAHPPGEEHNLTWSSPSKLSNILNDSTSPYFPPVTLPSLNGDLALNTSGSANPHGGSTTCPSNKISTATVSSCKGNVTNHAKKVYTLGGSIGAVQGETSTGGSFLSVSQLVNEPSKSFSGNSGVTMSNNVGVCQKSTNNNYSAEALIGSAYTHPPSVGHESGRKDKLFDYGTSALESVPSSSGPLTFNFDTYGGNTSGVDYNKGYNFSNQQNGYMTSSYGEAAYSGSSNGVGSVNSVAASGIPYYGKASSSQGYYNQSNLESSMMDLGSAPSTVANYTNPSQPTASANTMGQEYTSFYLPTFGEKKQYPSTSHSGSTTEQTTSKSKKSHKPSTGATVPTAEYLFNTTIASTIATTMMSSTTSSSYNFSSFGSTSNNSTLGASSSLGHSENDSSSYPNYNHARHHHNYHHQQQPRLPAQQSSSVTSESFSSSTSSSTTRKTSSCAPTTHTTPSYSYNTQYLSTKATQQAHYEVSHQSTYPAAPTLGSHHLNLPACINPTPAVSYGNVPTSNQPAYGKSSTVHQGHPYRQTSQHHHQQHHSQQQQPSLPHQPGTTSASMPNSSSTTSGTTITNFNLSTICPEINEKTGRSRDGVRSGVASGGPLRIPSSAPASILPHW
uniref:BHLH domain-containing protein n=1 Tax=Anopheles christyi TaxID=43041 RepID=A0A182K557_9DIPT